MYSPVCHTHTDISWYIYTCSVTRTIVCIYTLALSNLRIIAFVQLHPFTHILFIVDQIPRDILLEVLGPSKVYKQVIKKVINSTVAEYVEKVVVWYSEILLFFLVHASTGKFLHHVVRFTMTQYTGSKCIKPLR